jgi:anti-sigma B factor antagonist
MEGIQVSAQMAGSQNQISIIKVGGYIDTTTSSEVERALNSLLKQGRYQIIIDLGNVDYISSAGWGIFISEIKQIRENNGDLKLVQMIPDVYEIFELLEFHHILDVYDSVQAAINKFEESQFVEMIPRHETRSASPQPAPQYAEAPPRPAAASRPMPQPQQQPRPGIPGPNPNQMPRFTSNEPPQTGTRRPTILDKVNMSVEEKIKHIVATYPDLGAYKINKKLNSPDFGFTKVGWFGVRSWLNKLGLNSRKNRRHFAENFRQMAS